jgi:microcystin-dependent protein
VVESVTAHYGWTKPEITKSASTWGGFLNSDLDSIDALVFANQQGLVPIGSISMFGGATAPTNWLLCQGQSLSTTGTYAALFAVLGYAYGGSGANFNLPNLQGKFPLGVTGTAAPGAAGGASAVTLATANLPAHAHAITDVAHNHSLSDPTHNHSQTPHTHGVTDPGHAHTGGFAPSGGLFNSGVGPGLAQNTGTNTTGISVQGSSAGINAAAAGISLSPAGTGLGATQNTGSGTPLSLPLPPYITINFIVRYQ